MVMPATWDTPIVHYWAGRMPGSVGYLYTPRSQGKDHRFPWMPIALDNGAFTGFDEKQWNRLLWWASCQTPAPLWAAVPDVVGDRMKTLERWEQYHGVVEAYGMPMAFVVQDGMKKLDVPSNAEVVFVGGSTEWKWDTVGYWCRNFPRVHVGRVNTRRWLNVCRKHGAESVDGTGWHCMNDKRAHDELVRFWQEEENG